MADTGKQSPLGMNVLGGILQNRCLLINPNAQFFMGVSKSNSQYTYGELVEGTVLRMQSIHQALGLASLKAQSIVKQLSLEYLKELQPQGLARLMQATLSLVIQTTDNKQHGCHMILQMLTRV